MSRFYPNWFDAYLKYTENHESTRRVRLWCAISVVAASLERRVYLPRGYYQLFPNLYTFIIGRSGLVKKSTSTGIAVNLLRELTDESQPGRGIRIMSDRLTANHLIEQLVLSGKTYSIGKREFKQSALFAYASELAVFMEEVFGNITSLLTTFYDCVPNDSSKPWVYGTIGRGERKVYGPCLNILGASTKAWLKKCIPHSEMEGGFTSRIIFVVENKLPEKLVAWPEVTEEHETMRLKLVEDLRRMYELAGKFTIEPKAKKLFETWYEIHMKTILPKNQEPKMVGYMSRKGDTILKLAMAHSAATSDDLVITQDGLIWATEELEDLEQDWRLAFDSTSSSGALTFEILDFIRKKVFVSKKELFEVFSTTNQMADIVKSIRELKGMDEIVTYYHPLEETDGKLECYAVFGYEELLSFRKSP